MADTTTVMALPFPEGSDANDVPADMQALAERLDEAPGIESLTSAEISALTAGQKPAGRVVYNSTTNRYMASDGSAFYDLVDTRPYAVGVRSSTQSISTSETTVTYTSDTDPLAMLNAGTGVLTVPTAGLWLLSATISANVMGGTLGYFAIRDIGGSTFVAHMSYLAKFYTLTTLVYASASATYDVRTIGSSGTVDVPSARFSAVQLVRT